MLNDASISIKSYTEYANSFSVTFNLGVPLAAFTSYSEKYSYRQFIVIAKASDYYNLWFMHDSGTDFLNSQYSGYYYVYYI